AFAQSLPTPYLPNFTSAPDAVTFFEYDIPDSAFYSPTAVYQLLYRNSGSTIWSTDSLSVSYQTCSTWTVSGSISYIPPSGTLEYYFRSETDTIVVSQSPKNTANTFPVPADLLADMGSDPASDVVSGGSHLDITASAMSYSDTRIYGRLTNAGGGFPTSSGLDFYLYSIGIIDPDAADSAAYAMIYVNVPFVLSSGLYKINPVDSSFAKIGNISTNISGNNLSLACNISDLLAQPGWSTWPPPSGLIFAAPVTATQSLTGALTSNDIGAAGGFVPAAQTLTFGANTAPTLTGASVVSASGSALASVTFTDTENNLATLRQFYLAGVPFDMAACIKQYQSGTTFDASIDIDTAGWYEYYFTFSDGRDTVSTAPQLVHLDLPIIGDCDNSGFISISDAVFLITYIFAGGPAPNPLYIGDVDCDALVTISDAVYIINYIFAGGLPPCIS
ncbi:MAG: hypothetical protein WBP42_13005, partial [Candidatus Zixiibacteriota bacterium]